MKLVTLSLASSRLSFWVATLTSSRSLVGLAGGLIALRARRPSDLRVVYTPVRMA
jgi:hypothetical protein